LEQRCFAWDPSDINVNSVRKLSVEETAGIKVILLQNVKCAKTPPTILKRKAGPKEAETWVTKSVRKRLPPATFSGNTIEKRKSRLGRCPKKASTEVILRALRDTVGMDRNPKAPVW